MLGDLFNDNKRRSVCTREGQVMYLGRKYSQEPGTGYYMCTSGKRRRLHDVMWEHEHGVEVPPGCVIHHLDWDKTHNDVGNLICVTVEEHERIHNIIGGDEGKTWGYELIKSRQGGLPPSIIKK